MPYDTNTPADPELRRIADRAAAKTADMNRWVAKAKGGNPRRLVSARDALGHALAEIGNSLSPRKDR